MRESEESAAAGHGRPSTSGGEVGAPARPAGSSSIDAFAADGTAAIPPIDSRTVRVGAVPPRPTPPGPVRSSGGSSAAGGPPPGGIAGPAQFTTLVPEGAAARRSPLHGGGRASGRIPTPWLEDSSDSTLPPVVASALRAGTGDARGPAPSTSRGRRARLVGMVGAVLLIVAAVVVTVVLQSGRTPASAGPAGPSPAPAGPPVTLTAVVHDAGAAGLSLRSTPSLDPATVRGTVRDGGRITVVCGAAGPLVSGAGQSSSTWLRAGDGTFVSLLYARVDGASSIVNCAPGGQQLALLPVANGPTMRPSTESPSESACCQSRSPRRTPVPTRPALPLPVTTDPPAQDQGNQDDGTTNGTDNGTNEGNGGPYPDYTTGDEGLFPG